VNSELGKAGAYNKLTKKKVTALADIRNSAAYCKWTEVIAADVKDDPVDHSLYVRQLQVSSSNIQAARLRVAENIIEKPLYMRQFFAAFAIRISLIRHAKRHLTLFGPVVK
jgi:hypothetical protein